MHASSRKLAFLALGIASACLAALPAPVVVAAEAVEGEETKGDIRGAKELFFDPAAGAGRVVAVDPVAPREAAETSGGSGEAHVKEQEIETRMPEPDDPPLETSRSVDRPPPGPVALVESGSRPASGDGEASVGGEGRDASTVNLGLRHWIDLVEGEDGTVRQVTSDRTFHSGERIRLRFESNRAGYISLLLLDGERSEILFPRPDLGLSDHRMKANEVRTLPSPEAWLRFDHQKGIERILVIFAPDAEAVRQQMRPESRPDTATARSVVQLAGNLRGSKGLLVETERSSSAELGTYAVNPRGNLIMLEIHLTHE